MRVLIVEDMPAEARHANAEIARNVAEVAAAAGIRLIHLSTDHLFSGIHQFYAEQATPEPLNEYARSKLLAEQWVQLFGSIMLIILQVLAKK